MAEERDITVTIIDRAGVENQYDAPADMNLNLMEVCKMYELPVKGECGGMALCATCQVYVESDHELPAPSDGELAMLDQAFFVKPNSRLACQLYVHPELNGLVIRLAPEQE